MAKIKDNSKALLLEVTRRKVIALDKLGAAIVADARETVHVKTGATRDSIEAQVQGGVLKVGAGTPYADWLEVTYPFLRPAIHRARSRFKKGL